MGLTGPSETVIAGLIVMLWLLVVTVLATESVTFTVNCNVPADIGVPVIIPLPAPKTNGAIEPEASAKV